MCNKVYLVKTMKSCFCSAASEGVIRKVRLYSSRLDSRMNFLLLLET